MPQIRFCGGPTPNTSTVTFYPFVCPYCKGSGSWSEGERCMNCHGYGLTDDVRGWEEGEITRAPTPPAVMRAPCVDCAYRPGSPEAEHATAPGATQPFYCHHGLFRQDDGYVSAANLDNGLPLGAMVCAGWWALASGQPLPEREFRDPGGSDRHADAPGAPTRNTA
jgi:hypothetical protein